MIGSTGLADMMPSAKLAAIDVIEKQPQDASLDEIVGALRERSTGEPGGTDACNAAANRLLAVNPAELVMAGRAAHDALNLGVSRRIALDVVRALPERASLADILVAVATWHWPDDSVD